MDSWGKHAIFDVTACDIELITSADNIKAFVIDLVEKINMTAYGKPIVEHFAQHDPEKSGYSLVQLIETSSITGHFVDKNGNAYIDVFSCKDFDVATVEKVIHYWFRPNSIISRVFERDAK